MHISKRCGRCSNNNNDGDRDIPENCLKGERERGKEPNRRWEAGGKGTFFLQQQ
jgi:hypothetical protein